MSGERIYYAEGDPVWISVVGSDGGREPAVVREVNPVTGAAVAVVDRNQVIHRDWGFTVLGRRELPPVTFRTEIRGALAPDLQEAAREMDTTPGHVIATLVDLAVGDGHLTGLVEACRVEPDPEEDPEPDPCEQCRGTGPDRYPCPVEFGGTCPLEAEEVADV